MSYRSGMVMMDGGGRERERMGWDRYDSVGIRV